MRVSSFHAVIHGLLITDAVLSLSELSFLRFFLSWKVLSLSHFVLMGFLGNQNHLAA